MGWIKQMIEKGERERRCKYFVCANCILRLVNDIEREFRISNQNNSTKRWNFYFGTKCTVSRMNRNQTKKFIAKIKMLSKWKRNSKKKTKFKFSQLSLLLPQLLLLLFLRFIHEAFFCCCTWICARRWCGLNTITHATATLSPYILLYHSSQFTFALYFLQNSLFIYSSRKKNSKFNRNACIYFVFVYILIDSNFSLSLSLFP